MWCVADLNDAYIAKMEEVLEVYEKPFDAAEPVGVPRREAGYIACRCEGGVTGRARTGSAPGQRV